MGVTGPGQFAPGGLTLLVGPWELFLNVTPVMRFAMKHERNYVPNKHEFMTERGEMITYGVIYAALFLWSVMLIVGHWPSWLLS